MTEKILTESGDTIFRHTSIDTNNWTAAPHFFDTFGLHEKQYKHYVMATLGVMVGGTVYKVKFHLYDLHCLISIFDEVHHNDTLPDEDSLSIDGVEWKTSKDTLCYGQHVFEAVIGGILPREPQFKVSLTQADLVALFDMLSESIDGWHGHE